MGLEIGLQAALVHVISADDTALAVGSGDVPVLATPRLLALCEAACVGALAEAPIDPATTSVGTRVELEHLRASPVGETVRAAARLEHVDGRLLRFEVVVTDDADRLVGRAVITRVLVDRVRFLDRVDR
jgi:fluoroacetyl-CoA thioesterase